MFLNTGKFLIYYLSLNHRISNYNRCDIELQKYIQASVTTVKVFKSPRQSAFRKPYFGTVF